MLYFEVEPGIKLHYVVDDYTDPWSESEVVLMHHGIAQDLRRWARWIPYVARQYRIVRFDFRGFGESSIPPASYIPSLEGLLVDARRLLAHLNIEKVHFVGASTGGMVGMLFAARHPERTLSLTLLNTIPGMALSPADLDAWTRKIDATSVRAMFEEQVHDRFNLDIVSNELVEWYLQQWSKVNPSWLKRMFRAVNVDISDVLPKIAAPTLIIWGENDRVLPRPTQELMRDRIPHAQLQIVPGHAHNVFEAAGDEGGQILASFLRDIRERSTVTRG